MGNFGDLSPGGSIAIGILVGLVSTNVQSIGLTLQRKSHLLEDGKDSYDLKRPPYRRRRWQLGMAMFILSNLVGSTIQITTLPLPVLSTLQASGLVFNSICATFVLGEPFTQWSMGGTILVSSGAVLIAIFGAIPEPAHSLDQLLFLLSRPAFIHWMILQAVLVFGIIIIIGFLSHLPSLSSNARIRLSCGLAYGGVSGILSAHSLLVAKSAVELLVCTIVNRNNQFNRWQSWIILLGLIILALTQLYYLHCGLKLVSTSILYPIVFCIYNIIAILDGLIYFKQTDRLEPLHAGLIALGTVILLSGVLALSWRLSDEQSQPAVGKSALAPGLGFIEDTDNEDYSDSIDPDEEAAISAERQPLLSSISDRSKKTLDIIKERGRYSRKSVRLANTEDISSMLDYGSQSTPRSMLLSSSRRVVTMPNLYTQNVQEEPRSEPIRTRRRKSTGFPGFAARPTPKAIKKKTNREKRGEFWKMNWLGLKPNRCIPDEQTSSSAYVYNENDDNENIDVVNNGNRI